MSIELRGIVKRFGDFVAVDHVDLSVAAASCWLCSDPPARARPACCGSSPGWNPPMPAALPSTATMRPTCTRATDSVGFVFQHYALFGHLSIFENVAFGLRVRPRRERLPSADISRRVHRLLDLVQLDALADRFPHQLSGGQRQRIALARALAVEPKVLLLDEPFGALDARVRQELRRWLRRLHDEVHVTSVFVTHDQEEALEVADRVVVMNHGRVEQVGTPAEIYDHPATPFVFEFLGQFNRWPGPADTPAAGFARPHEIGVSREAGAHGLPARLLHSAAVGPRAKLEFALEPDRRTIDVELPRETARALDLAVGEIAYLRPTRLRQFEVDTTT